MELQNFLDYVNSGKTIHAPSEELAYSGYLTQEAMTQDEFRREKLYLTAMGFAYKLLSEGKITEGNYHQFDTKMRAKYRPKIGTLLAEKRLLEGRFRALLDVRKEAGNGESTENSAEESAGVEESEEGRSLRSCVHGL